MANHDSSKKRIRQSEKKRVHNRYFAVTTRNLIKKFNSLESKEEAQVMLPKVTSMVDRLAKRNIIHKNKAANLKSKMTKRFNKMA